MDFSIALPAETVEGLFCEQEDDHAALPNAWPRPSRVLREMEHDDLMDHIVESKTPAHRIALYNAGRRMQGFINCAKMDAIRRERRGE